MGRVALKRVSLFNFRSFFGEHTITFDDRGLYLVRGSNVDSRGESGAGKSSLLLAIAYALNFAPYSLADLTNWDATEMWVEIELDTEAGPVVIHRGDKLWLKPGTGKKITSAKAVEEKLQEILKIPGKLREAITYRRQLRPGMFLSKNDSEKKAFLVELLGLHWLEKEINAQVKVVTNAQKDVEALVPFVEAKQADLKHYEGLHQPYKAVSPALYEETARQKEALIADIKTKLESLSALRKRALDKQDDRSECERLKELFTECVKRETRAQAIEDQARAEYLTLRREYLAEQDSLLNLEHKGIALHLRRQLLQNKKCTECKRPWEDAAQELVTVEEQYAAIAEKITAIRAKQEPPPYQSDGKLENLRELRAGLQQRLADAELVIEQARNQRVSRYQNQIEVLMHALQDANVRLMDAKNSINGVRLFNQAHAERAEGEQKSLQRLREARNAELAKLHNAKGVLAAEQDYLDMLRGFMGKYFADILTQISDEANKIIGNLPNTAHVTLWFDVERETQDGKTRNEITPSIYFGDRKWNLDAGASGGMYTSIELAVDLAVGRIIADRTGCDIGWLILDESFTGHDKITKESCLQILQQYASDKLIIIVDHASEFKEMFSRVVEVKFHNGRSTLET